MNPHETRILFVGDMHLGTHLSRVPEAVGGSAGCGPAAAWSRTVDTARRLGVHAVVLAGDVVNSSNAVFEARRPLDRGLGELAEAGIPVLAVAGNHDTATLPELARRDERLHLLGADGTWSDRVVVGEGGPPVRIVGWSFPRPHWQHSPLASPPPTARADEITFGVLHGDLDAPSSPYAPVASLALRDHGYDGWFLGHVHTPGPVPADGTPFYLGSLTGLDPSETGDHGPVLVSVAMDRATVRERLPLAPLVWADVEIPVGDAASYVADPHNVILAGLERWMAAHVHGRDAVLGARVTLTGDVDDPEAVRKATGTVDPTELVTDIQGRPVFVDRLDTTIHTRIDLMARSRDADPVGLLARRVGVLSGEIEDPELLARLLSRAGDAAAEVDELPACRRLDPPPPAEHRAMLTRAARRLLDRMLADRESVA